MVSVTASAALFSLFGLRPGRGAGMVRVYVGTYTRGRSKSRGIYLLGLDPETGAMKSMGLAAETENPAFLALHPSGQTLYAVNELVVKDGIRSGAVTAFEIERRSGKLKRLNEKPTRGSAPCYVVVDGSGRHVLFSNYAGGNVGTMPIQPDGTLGDGGSFVQHEGSSVNPKRQEAPHAHSINLDAANRFALVADLGLDEVLVYGFDPESGELTSKASGHARMAPGAGPRHLAFGLGEHYVYVVNELDLTVTVLAFDRDKGALTSIQTVSTLPESERNDIPTNYSGAEVRVHPTGRFLYASNRGHDSIAVFSIDPDSGLITLIQNQSTLGRTPRNFTIDPTGRILLAANQDSNEVVSFGIDRSKGFLSPTGFNVRVPTPVCLRLFVDEQAA